MGAAPSSPVPAAEAALSTARSAAETTRAAADAAAVTTRAAADAAATKARALPLDVASILYADLSGRLFFQSTLHARSWARVRGAYAAARATEPGRAQHES